MATVPDFRYALGFIESILIRGNRRPTMSQYTAPKQ